MKADYRLSTAELRGAVLMWLEKHAQVRRHQLEDIRFEFFGDDNGEPKIVTTATVDASRPEPTNPRD